MAVAVVRDGGLLIVVNGILRTVIILVVDGDQLLRIDCSWVMVDISD